MVDDQDDGKNQVDKDDQRDDVAIIGARDNADEIFIIGMQICAPTYFDTVYGAWSRGRSRQDKLESPW